MMPGGHCKRSDSKRLNRQVPAAGDAVPCFHKSHVKSGSAEAADNQIVLPGKSVYPGWHHVDRNVSTSCITCFQIVDTQRGCIQRFEWRNYQHTLREQLAIIECCHHYSHAMFKILTCSVCIIIMWASVWTGHSGVYNDKPEMQQV